MSRTAAAMLLVASALAACGGEPLRSVSQVDLPRYAGDWYVVAHLPTRPERNAYDAIEHYSLRPNGRIRVRFTFREGGHDGERRLLRFRAHVVDHETSAEWRVSPFWPISLAYVVTYLDPDYRVTVVGHPSRSYAWVMARSPTLDRTEWEAVCGALVEGGFRADRLRAVPHAGITLPEAPPCPAAASEPPQPTE